MILGFYMGLNGNNGRNTGLLTPSGGGGGGGNGPLFDSATNSGYLVLFEDF